MKRGHSTAEVAQILGVSKNTVLRWLADGFLVEPKRERVAGIEWRIWSDADIAAAKKIKATMRPGPKHKAK